jgi:hypothetical protein
MTRKGIHVARPQGGRPATVFYPLGHPTLSAYGSTTQVTHDGSMIGESYDQAEAEWIVIRTQLRGHNDTPLGRPSSRPGCYY